MSGIVGVVQFDHRPLDCGLLQELTDSLSFRGPDAQRIWANHNVGFGHALFKTNEESEGDSQPFTLHGKTWIVADARIDAREDLCTALKAAGESGVGPLNSTDAELILRAYHCWGQDCVERLLGDFAFGIWDDARQELFCARDHMGVKPFYYAQAGSTVVFSNTLDCIRRHPAASDKLNDLAIADLLLFGVNQDSAATSFADIKRLAPATRAVWSRSGMRSNCYWSLPIDEPIFYRRPEDYIDQFRDLLHRSVADRLRTSQVWVFMSGGIDSPTLAAAASELLRKQCAHFDLRALTKADSFVPEEARYAKAVARHLQIPILYRYWTEDVDLRWEQIPFSTPEPTPHAWIIPAENNFWRKMGSYSRVFFYGEGPDNALRCEWKPYFTYLLEQRDYGQLVRSGIVAVLAERRPPFWGRISTRLRKSSYFASDPEPAYPQWLNPSFEARLDLRTRWTNLNAPAVPLHPYRPAAYRSLQIPLWQAMFESLDPGVTKNLFEVRHPFVDIRMLRFLLSVPSLPWCRSKYLLRTAMRGKLPAEVLRRRKTAVGGSPLESFWAALCTHPFTPAAPIGEYIDIQRLHSQPPPDLAGRLRVRSLNHWLQNSHRSSHNRREDSLCDRAAG